MDHAQNGNRLAIGGGRDRIGNHEGKPCDRSLVSAVHPSRLAGSQRAKRRRGCLDPVSDTARGDRIFLSNVSDLVLEIVDRVA